MNINNSNKAKLYNVLLLYLLFHVKMGFSCLCLI